MVVLLKALGLGRSRIDDALDRIRAGTGLISEGRMQEELKAMFDALSFTKARVLLTYWDWFTRRVLSWRVSITLEADFCIEAVEEALARHGKPEIFNTDQGVQFTSKAWIGAVEGAGVRVSMDGKGRCFDNIFVERLWRR